MHSLKTPGLRPWLAGAALALAALSPAARAEVTVAFIRDPLAPTPRDYLLGQSLQWWPGLSDADRMSNISRQEKRLAGRQATFWCLYRDDVMNLAGDAICLLDTPDAELVVRARSTMAFTADEGVDAVLAGVSLR